MLEEREAWKLVLALMQRLDRRKTVPSLPLSAAPRENRSDGEGIPLVVRMDGATGAGMTTNDLGLIVAPSGDWQCSHPVSEEAKSLLDLFVPLCLAGAASARGSFTVGHLGQSLDGRIATENGASKWITGDADQTHTHRMRALSDAIVVGAGTVRHDDPLLTVRRCDGRNPLRVVIDTNRRLGRDYHVFQDEAAPTYLICAEELARDARLGAAKVIGLPRAIDGGGRSNDEGVSVVALLAELAGRGIKRVFVEGGGVTVSRFLRAGCLDRLQITISPLIIGSGRPGISLPRINSVARSLRPPTRRFALGEDIMIECDFSA